MSKKSGVSCFYYGDIIEVRLMDNTEKIFFKYRVYVDNKKDMLRMVKVLKEKGVNLTSSWYD